MLGTVITNAFPVDYNCAVCILVGSFQVLHTFRSQHDAVLVGVNTFLIDKPQLNVRYPMPTAARSSSTRHPRVVILDSLLRSINCSQQDLLKLHRPIICTCVAPSDPAYLQMESALTPIGGMMIHCSSMSTGRIDLSSCLQQLYAAGVCSVLVEGGASVLQSFLEYGRVNQVLVSIQPSFLGTSALITDGMLISYVHRT